MKPKLIILTGVLTVIAISGLLFSQNIQDGNKNRAKKNFQEKLNLSEDQLDKIEKLKLSHKKEMIGWKSEVEKKEIELEELKNSQNFSREEYLKKIDGIITAKNKMEIAKANHQMDIYQLLDVNQKKVWNKLTQMMHQRKHKVVRKMIDRDRDKDINLD